MPETATPAPQREPTLADLIAPHIPFLRRYARALCGAQASGDAYVAALLEAALADPGMIRTGQDPKVALYAAFQRLWESSQVEPPPGEATDPDPRMRVAQERLSALPPRSTQALLLTAIESFSAEEAAAVLRVTPEDVVELVDEARAALAAQLNARVLIIEDDAIIAMDIESIVTDLGHQVVAITATRDAAVAAAMEHRPDLVLADINLADGSSGIDAVRDILQAMTTPVIFITAYPERLLTGSRPEPTFLITKPFKVDAVRAALSQAVFYRSSERLG